MKNRYVASFNRRRRMKAEIRQIPQKLAARLKFVWCTYDICYVRAPVPLLPRLSKGRGEVPQSCTPVLASFLAGSADKNGVGTHPKD